MPPVTFTLAGGDMLRGRSFLKVLFLLSLIVNIYLLIELYNLYNRVISLENENKQLKTSLYNVSQQLEKIKNNYEILKRENLLLKESLTKILQRFSYHTANLTSDKEYDWIPIVGVKISSNIFESRVEGLTMKLYMKLEPGANRVFISTKPKIGIDLQEAAEQALKVALNLTGKNGYDCYIIICANESINVVDGPSAGAAITVLAYFKLIGLTPRKDVVITGEILSDGRIGPVGAILEKAIAAAKSGAKIFLVPYGQGIITKPIYEVKKIGPVTIKYLKGFQKILLENYLKSLGFNMRVIEVKNIREAVNYFMPS